MLRSATMWLAFLSTALLFGCNDDDPQTIVFSGITERNEFAQILGQVDDTDWRVDDSWMAQELVLFNGSTPLPCPLESPGFSIFVYPNPNNGTTAVGRQSPMGTVLDIRVVDADFNVVFSQDDQDAGTFFIDLTGLPAGLYRMYYKFKGQGCELRGHGDIQIEP